MKTYISYVPHGINEKNFYPITEGHPQYNELKTFRKNLLNNKEYDFVLLFNSRNIRRKSIPDTLLAFKTFLDTLPSDKAIRCCIVLHTQPVDDNGTDLIAVREMLFGDLAEHHVIFSKDRADGNYMNLLYNCADGVILLSSNEGWGLSITEGLMCGKMVICNVTGGLQDQLRFTDEEGRWIQPDEKFSSNHFGKYKTHGPWGIGVIPNNISLQGSPQTPFIFDDRVAFQHAAEAISILYNYGPEERQARGTEGRKWVTSDESKMSAENMSKNIIKSVDHIFDNWEPREEYEVIKVGPRKKKYVKYPVSI